MNEDPAIAFARHFNYAEATLWWLIAVVLLWRLRKASGKWHWQRWGVPLAFAAFGVSDCIEAHTGAWWEPWWLFVLKAVCVLTFVLALCQHGKPSPKG